MFADDDRASAPSGWRRRARCWSATSRWRTRRRLEPAERELYVEAVLDGGLMLRGYIDRLDVAPTGEVRVVDYKTGSAPRAGLRGQGAVPDEVLRAGAVAAARRGAPRCCSWCISAAAARCCATPPTRRICWRPSARCRRCGRRSSGRWRPASGGPGRSRLCDWCDHQALCPEFGGTPPPLPERQPGDTVRSNRPPAATDELYAAFVPAVLQVRRSLGLLHLGLQREGRVRREDRTDGSMRSAPIGWWLVACGPVRACCSWAPATARRLGSAGPASLHLRDPVDAWANPTCC